MNAFNKIQGSLTSPRDKIWKLVLGESSDFHEKLNLEERRHRLANFLKIYFDFAYYLGGSPFRFVQDEVTRLYSLKTWMPQQVLCGIFHLLALVTLVGGIRDSLPDEQVAKSNSPTPYFKLVLSFCSLFYKTVTMKRFWLNRNLYLKVMNTIVAEKNLPNCKTKLTSRAFSICLCTFNVFQILVCVFGGYSYVHPSWNWTPAYWFKRLIVYGRFLFGVEGKMSHDFIPSEIHFGDVMLALAALAANFSRNVIAFYCDLILFVSSLTLWSASSSFADEICRRLNDEDAGLQDESSIFIVKPLVPSVRAKEMKKIRDRDGREDWTWMYQHFQGIQTLSVAFSSALGHQVTWYMAEGLMYYSINLNSVLLTDDMYQKVNLTTYYITTYIILCVSADICNQIGTIKLWMSKNGNMKKIPQDEATLVLHEMVTKEVGLRGGDTFTVTFPLVATFLSLIITFFIICIQQADVVKIRY